MKTSLIQRHTGHAGGQSWVGPRLARTPMIPRPFQEVPLQMNCQTKSLTTVPWLCVLSMILVGETVRESRNAYLKVRNASVTH